MKFSSNASAQKYYQFCLQEGLESHLDTCKTLQDRYRGRDEVSFNTQVELEGAPERLRSGQPQHCSKETQRKLHENRGLCHGRLRSVDATPVPGVKQFKG